jgi:hypothetical protein
LMELRVGRELSEPPVREGRQGHCTRGTRRMVETGCLDIVAYPVRS